MAAKKLFGESMMVEILQMGEDRKDDPQERRCSKHTESSCPCIIVVLALESARVAGSSRGVLPCPEGLHRGEGHS